MARFFENGTLKLSMARTVLDLGVYLWFFSSAVAVLGGIICILIALFDHTGKIKNYFKLPVDINVIMNGNAKFHITEWGQAGQMALWQGLGLGIVLIVFGIVGLILFSRAMKFVSRVINDPFHIENSVDLMLASKAALLLQVLNFIFTGLATLFSPAAQAAATLERALGQAHTTVSVSPIGVSFWPLLLAAALAVLATVFRRGHDLRETERQLRQEQELTI